MHFIKKFKSSLQSATLLVVLLIATSHVGSPGVIFEGLLGPYRVLANINPPAVVPGTALVTVILPEDPEGIHLEARPVYWSAGIKGTPTADPLAPVEGEMGRYEGEMWFMESGTSSVQLVLKSGEETFEAIIPVMAMPTAQNEMPKELGIALSILGVFLVILMVTIIASAMGDSLREPGVPRDSRLAKRKYIGTAIGSVFILLILWGGKSWWEAEAEAYQSQIFKPIEAVSHLNIKEDGDYLHLTIDSTSLTQGRITRKISYIVPDHGKLMHLFLIRKGDLDVFAHLHPKRLDSLNYEVKLPPLPSGEYHVFADITRFTGFSETIVSDLVIPQSANFNLASQREVILGRDDTYTFSNPISNQSSALDDDIMICGKPGIKTPLPNGYSAVWETENDKFEAGRLYNLNFALFDADGEPAVLEPYLGMMGHAVVLKHDGLVYIHLHPTGNYSMGSQKMLLNRFQSGAVGFQNLPGSYSFQDSIDHVISFLDELPEVERDSLLMGDMLHYEWSDEEHEEHTMVSFPYAFPEEGNYRLWIQVKLKVKLSMVLLMLRLFDS